MLQRKILILHLTPQKCFPTFPRLALRIRTRPRVSIKYRTGLDEIPWVDSLDECGVGPVVVFVLAEEAEVLAGLRADVFAEVELYAHGFDAVAEDVLGGEFDPGF